MHLLNCIFPVISIATVVYANCVLNAYNVNSPTCNYCKFENLRNITERVIPNGCVLLDFVDCHFGRLNKGLVNPEVQVHSLWMIASVEFIEDGAFDDYKKAHTIWFRKNNISLLPDYAFRLLSNLKNVDFSENQLVKIGENVFTGASSITHLNLAHNRIESFCIKQLVNLKSVNLENNLITVVSEIPKTLYEANFSYNRLSKIANVTFRNMKSLSILLLGWNNITEIESEAFYGADHLHHVDLSCNNLTIVSNVMEESNLHSFFILILQQNKITSFSPKNLTIYDASVLIGLDLSENSIEQLDKSKFNVTTNINILDLNYNKITTVPIAFFHSQYHENPIRELALSTNAITQLEVGSFLGLGSLEILDLSHNCIQTLNETIFLDTPNLQELNLADNRIRNLNGPEIIELTRLNSIVLEGNKFSNFTYAMEQFTNNTYNNVHVAVDWPHHHKRGNIIDCDLEFSKEIAVKDGISTAGIVIISILCVAAIIFILIYAIYYKTVRQPVGNREELQEFANIN